MKFSDINYGPLEYLKNAFIEAGKHFFKGKYGPARVAAVLLLSVLFMITTPYLLWLVAVPIVIWFMYTTTKIKTWAWRQFAAVNKWQMSPADINQIPPGLQNIGHSRKMSEIITAQFDSLICDFYSYQFTIGYGKSSQTYYFTVVRTRLGEAFPHIVLDGKNYRNLNLLKGYKQLKLEGDFNKYFKLYLSPGQEIDVLSIITPDVMQTLINANQKQDIEIYGDSIYFIGMNDERSPLAFKILLSSVEALSAEILHRAKSLNYQLKTPI